MTDVVTDPEYRGNGAAKQLMETMVNCDELRELRGVLLTKDAMPLYESVGFGNYAGTFMAIARISRFVPPLYIFSIT